MDMASIQAAVMSLKAAADIASGLIKLKTASEIQAKVAELNAEIISAQTSALAANSEQFALLKKVRDLEEEVARVKAWEAEKERYELHEHTAGIFTRRLKASMQSGEPMHEICANCYETQRKSPLQTQRGERHTTVLFCPACKTGLSFYD